MMFFYGNWLLNVALYASQRSSWIHEENLWLIFFYFLTFLIQKKANYFLDELGQKKIYLCLGLPYRPYQIFGKTSFFFHFPKSLP